MIQVIVPKLPMRNKAITKAFYTNQLGFIDIGTMDYDGYLLLKKETIELHFFEFKTLNPLENYGQVYLRTNQIETLYQSFINKQILIHPEGKLQIKPWGQKEFSILDPDSNLLTFGEQL